MSFPNNFEEDVNRNMQEDTEQRDHSEEKNIKKHLDAKCEQEEDHELSEKKDRPPRFSTLFDGTPPPQIVERYIEQPRQKKRGIWIPLPLFIILAIILFFETTLLFAYTIIALDNNLGSGLFPISKTRLDTCPDQQAINVAPKFYLGAANSEPGAVPDKAPTTTTSSTTKPTATGIAQTTQVVVVTPTPGPPPSSTLFLTVNPSGSTISPSPKSTSTSTVNAKKRASIRSKFESIVSNNTLGQKQAPTPTTLVTAETSTSTEEVAATSSAGGGGGVCFGGSGAVGLVCPDGVGINTKV
jgi:hypothetical protein